MNADLERDLLEAGDGLGDVVAALRRAPQAHVAPGFAARVRSHLPHKGGFVRVRSRWLSPSVLLAVAASLVCAFVFVVFLVNQPATSLPVVRLASCQRTDGSFSSSSAAPYVQAFAVTVLAKDPSADRAALDRAVDTLVRSQDADGGWGNAALSAPSPHNRRNKFGSAKAIKNADASREEPRTAKKTISLRNPRILEQSVPVINLSRALIASVERD